MRKLLKKIIIVLALGFILYLLYLILIVRPFAHAAEDYVPPECRQPTPTPSPTPIPTATPTPIPECEECVEVTPTPQPTPTFSPPGPASNNASAPICSFRSTNRQMANFHVYRKGTLATVKWWPTEGSDAIIYYKLNGVGYWQHAFKTENDGYVIVAGLGGRDWTFAGQQVNGCGGGPLTPEVVDGGTVGWTLFR